MVGESESVEHGAVIQLVEVGSREDDPEGRARVVRERRIGLGYAEDPAHSPLQKARRGELQSAQLSLAPKTDTGPRSRLKAGSSMNW